jgi:hypothetical protein
VTRGGDALWNGLGQGAQHHVDDARAGLDVTGGDRGGSLCV